jgi:heat shock protein HtpX
MVMRVIGVSLFFIALFTLAGVLIGAAGVLIGFWGMYVLVFLGEAFFLISVLLIAVAYHYSPAIILKKYRAKPSDKKELNDIVEQMATNAKIPTPKAYVLPLDVPNAFAVRGKDAVVCVSEGVMSMNKGEIENIVAHEIWHIANGDVKIQQFASFIAAALRLTVIFIPLAVFTLKLGISERIEFKADYYATRFSGKPRDMASALNKISETARQNPMHGSPAFESIWIVNPFRREGSGRWFYTHPPTARRTKRVDEMAHEGMPEVPEATEVD